ASGGRAKKVTLFELVVALSSFGVDACQSLDELNSTQVQMLRERGVTYTGAVDRLESILRFLGWADLIVYDGSGVILSTGRLNEVRYQGSGRARDVELAEFYSALRDVYDRLHGSVYRSPFVPLVPELRNDVCRSLDLDEKEF